VRLIAVCVWPTTFRAARSGSSIHQLIINLKCPPTAAASDPRRRQYKRQAIRAIARALRAALERSTVEAVTWEPIPPSRPAFDEDYDDRLHRVLTSAFGDYDLDLRPLLTQCQPTPADHCSARRLSQDALYRVLRIEPLELERAPLRSANILVDDVLVTGKHFKCCERRLHEALGNIPVCGMFMARRVLARRR
jgi:hypothetical protein